MKPEAGVFELRRGQISHIVEMNHIVLYQYTAH